MKKMTKRQRAIRRRRIFLSLCAATAIALIAIICFVVSIVVNSFEKFDTVSDASQIVSSESGEPQEAKITASATVVNTGDIIVHSPILSGAKTADGGYDFSAFFKSAESYFKDANLAVANLEITCGGTESGAYAGYPAFNIPDVILDNIKASGINMLLTANNHSYDTGLFGLKRTAGQLKARNMDFIGTRETADEPIYAIKNVNGVKLGLAVYTYETSRDADGTKYINANPVASEGTNLINSFSYDYLDSFYNEAQTVISEMQNAGADAIVFYMHWGNEYQTAQNVWQETIAQKLCNMGVDVIVGGHPHVIQPVELLYAEGGDHTTVCIYSLGNAISNQRQELMDSCPTGHTEDGMLFYYTFDKYSDGETVLSSVDIIPTWVDKYQGGSGYQYTMYPLENAEDGINKYGLSGSAADKSRSSYNRTKEIIAPGLTECQNFLGCNIRFEEQVSE